MQDMHLCLTGVPAVYSFESLCRHIRILLTCAVYIHTLLSEFRFYTLRSDILRMHNLNRTEHTEAASEARSCLSAERCSGYCRFRRLPSYQELLQVQSCCCQCLVWKYQNLQDMNLSHCLFLKNQDAVPDHLQAHPPHSHQE